MLSGCAAFSGFLALAITTMKKRILILRAVDFVAEVAVQRSGKSKSVRDSVKYIRLQPLIAAERVVAADAFGSVAALIDFPANNYGGKNSARRSALWS